MRQESRNNYGGVLHAWRAPGFAAALAVAALGAVPALATPEANVSSPDECEARFEPAVLEAGTIHEEVAVSLSQNIGEVQEIETPDDSGLSILWTHTDEEDPLRARVRVSTVGAEAGAWSVILWGGGEETCRGEITIVDSH
jgi:hypothetical protein